jgi:hypothetical protein
VLSFNNTLLVCVESSFSMSYTQSPPVLITPIKYMYSNRTSYSSFYYIVCGMSAGYTRLMDLVLRVWYTSECTVCNITSPHLHHTKLCDE